MAKKVAFEGIECSGKTTTIEIVAQKLQHRGFTTKILGKRDSIIDEPLRVLLDESDETLTAFQKFLIISIRFIEKNQILGTIEGLYDFVLIDRFEVSWRVFAELVDVPKSFIHCFVQQLTLNEVDVYVYNKIDYSTFQNRWCLHRSTREGHEVNQEWFENKVKIIDEIFKQNRIPFVNCKNESDIESLVEILCTSMC